MVLCRSVMSSPLGGVGGSVRASARQSLTPGHAARTLPEVHPVAHGKMGTGFVASLARRRAGHYAAGSKTYLRPWPMAPTSPSGPWWGRCLLRRARHLAPPWARRPGTTALGSNASRRDNSTGREKQRALRVLEWPLGTRLDSHTALLKRRARSTGVTSSHVVTQAVVGQRPRPMAG